MGKIEFGEIFTIEREYQAGTLGFLAVVKLENIAFLGTEEIPPKLIGGKAIKRFSFMAVQKNGKGIIQFAKYNALDGTVLFEEILPYDICGSNGAGGWSEFGNLTKEDEKAFERILEGAIGVYCKAKKVSKQVVNGINYRFKVEAKGIYPDAKPYDAIVHGHIAPDGTVNNLEIF